MAGLGFKEAIQNDQLYKEIVDAAYGAGAGFAALPRDAASLVGLDDASNWLDESVQYYKNYENIGSGVGRFVGNELAYGLPFFLATKKLAVRPNIQLSKARIPPHLQTAGAIEVGSQISQEAGDALINLNGGGSY